MRTTLQTIPEDAWEVLASLRSEQRQQRMRELASKRLANLRLILEDIHDRHNIAACLRSAEAFGIGHVHIVDPRKHLQRSDAARGVERWMHLEMHQEVGSCVAALRNKGFAIAAAFPSQDSRPLAELPLDRPLAVVFGNEHSGLSAAWQEHLDYTFTIPMFGMVESLNISVSAAISLQELGARLRQSGAAQSLSAEEQHALLNTWICRQFRNWPATYKALKANKTKP